MRRALLIPLAIVVAVPVAGVAVAQFALNQDALRTRIETAVQKATGRQLTIAGPIRLGWSLTPTIQANDLSLANPPGFSRPAMVHIDRIEAKVGLLPLLSHRIEVTGLTITGPDAVLERDAAGRANWDFAKPAPAAPSSAPAAEPGQKLVLDVGGITLINASLAFAGTAVTAPRLTYDPASTAIAGDVAFRGTTLHVTGTATPPDLHLQGDGLSLAIAGANPFAISADVATLAALAPLAGTALPALRDVHLATRLTLAPAALTLDGLALTSAQGDLAGHLVIGRGPRPSVSGALRSTRFDLDALTPPPIPATPAPATSAPAAAPATGRLIPDTPILFARLRQADADLQIEAGSLLWHGRTFPGVAAHLALQDGTLRLDPATMAIGDKPLSLQLQADATAQTASVKLAAPGIAAGPLSTLLGGPATAAGRVDLIADLHVQGATWHAAAASLQGTAGLAMVDGEIDNAWLLDQLQDALRAANLPIPGGGDSKVRCAAIAAQAEAGNVRFTALTLDTSKLRLDGSGSIDLVDETLDLHLRPVLRLGAALSVPVHVGGSLRAPKVVLDPGALAAGRVGISIGGAPPPDSCGPALALARGGQPGPAPTTPEPAARPLKPADILRGLLR